MQDGNIMCGRCAVNHGPKIPKRRKRLSSAKAVTDATRQLDDEQVPQYCPVHGFKEIPGIFNNEETDTVTDNQMTRRVPSNGDYGDVTILLNRGGGILSDELSENTENADALSKKIRDSVEFTS